MKKIEVDAYVCENCGCVHLNPDEILSLNGIEFCVDCVCEMDIIVDPIYGIGYIKEILN
jgi:hypothetical protein